MLNTMFASVCNRKLVLVFELIVLMLLKHMSKGSVAFFIMISLEFLVNLMPKNLYHCLIYLST